MVGTSAGSVVGAQLLSGTDLQALYDGQLAPHQELTPTVDLDGLIALYAEVGDISAGIPAELARKFGAFAKQARTVPLEDRRRVIAWRLPSHEWPATELLITSVDADTGELVVLDASSGVSLVDAVTASCAVPGVWPPVPLLGRTLIDGGTRSIANTALAQGHDEVLVLLPMRGPVLAAVRNEVADLKGAVRLVCLDREGAEAIGPNPLDPAKRGVAAEAGLRQGFS